MMKKKTPRQLQKKEMRKSDSHFSPTAPTAKEQITHVFRVDPASDFVIQM